MMGLKKAPSSHLHAYFLPGPEELMQIRIMRSELKRLNLGTVEIEDDDDFPILWETAANGQILGAEILHWPKGKDEETYKRQVVRHLAHVSGWPQRLLGELLSKTEKRDVKRGRPTFEDEVPPSSNTTLWAIKRRRPTFEDEVPRSAHHAREKQLSVMTT